MRFESPVAFPWFVTSNLCDSINLLLFQSSRSRCLECTRPALRVGVSLIVESLTVARHQGQLEDECHSQDVLGWTSLPQTPTGRNDFVLLKSIHRERQQQDSGISYHSELQSINSSVNKTRSITIYRLIFYANMQLISIIHICICSCSRSSKLRMC